MMKAIGLAILLAGGPAAAADLTVLSSGGFTPAFRDLAPEFTRRTGDVTHLELGASMGTTATAIPARLARGETADVLLMVGYALEQLIKDGRAVPGSYTVIARSSIGMAVKAGAPHPDISTEAALKQTLLAARSVAYSDSASGVYLESELFPRLGIAEQMRGKARSIKGDPVGSVVANGEYELGFQQLSELGAIGGIETVGPLPAGAQRVTVYAAGMAAGSKEPVEALKLIAFLASPAAAAAVLKTGLETP